MRHPFYKIVASAALCVISASTFAQTTYKCGNTYSEIPCVDGKAVTAEDKRTDAQKSQADETTHRHQKAANKFERDRIKQEKRDAKALKDADKGSVVGQAKPGSESSKIGKVTPLRSLKPPKPPKPVKPPKPPKPLKPAKKTA